MSICIRNRHVARKLKRDLVKSLLQDDWKLSVNGFIFGNFWVYIKPARFRIFDQVVVRYKDNELWFPLLQRLCIRSAVRYRQLISASTDR